MGHIDSKKQYLELWHRGLLGNKLRSWDNVQELVRSGYDGIIQVRSRITGGPTRYNVLVNDVINQYISDRSVYFNEAAPDQSLTIQGEVCRSIRYYELFYSSVKDRMKPSLEKGGQPVYGLIALMILQKFMNPNSYDDLQTLFDMYPDSVIEFSCYDTMVGDCPRRNTLIWEVRNY